MKKTVYEVKYNGIGYNAPKIAYFETKQEAYDFYNKKEYADKPKGKSYGKEKAEKLISGTEEYFAFLEYEHNQLRKSI